MSEISDIRAYFKEQHKKAVRNMVYAGRITTGNEEALQKLLDAVAVPAVTDEQAVVATQLSDAIDGVL
jgi:acetylglutamate kinase